MEFTDISTPFGPRPATLEGVLGQLASAAGECGKAANKWKILRDIREARERLGLRDRAIAVLNALVSFHPGDTLAGKDNLVVFPSNEQLSMRAHGIAGTTLRENLTRLVDAGLIHRKDSPNGKRYARRDQEGRIVIAFGFNLAPLLHRMDEFAELAREVCEERHHVCLAREKISILRRDIRKLVDAGREAGIEWDWNELECRFLALVLEARQSREASAILNVREKLATILCEAVNAFKSHDKTNKIDANANEKRVHIQIQNTESHFESEYALKIKEQATSRDTPEFTSDEPFVVSRTYPLGLVLRCCPRIADYTPQGRIENWRDLMTAAVVVRSMLGISPSAYQDACETLGQENAASVIACILERAEHINSAGGYLRSLTRRADANQFSVGPMLMALMKRDAQHTSARSARGIGEPEPGM